MERVCESAEAGFDPDRFFNPPVAFGTKRRQVFQRVGGLARSEASERDLVMNVKKVVFSDPAAELTGIQVAGEDSLSDLRPVFAVVVRVVRPDAFVSEPVAECGGKDEEKRFRVDRIGRKL